ncbi:MAG: murein biosynthesis integral membrane protein MurJ [Euryhalocaulis sp.]|uniref:murein biosynthesis integral membrane protein MurJ n=1 Tax=Euryhalocaulis sp. TaxID=2744307 RepID=UPI0017C399B8|nr:murein biosynthesis integral membrane protein MurJ [Euryhalocaulis sp.]MBA4802376.1 murein biosynthesis integral membrane protein MurJ [Euryhalocaulis sp.]
MRLLRSTFVIGGYTLVSRILGFVREMLLAGVLGAGPVADIFLLAFRFPNLFRRVFAEGAFNAAFVPLYSRRIAAEGQEAADRFASDVLSGLTLVVGALTVLAIIAMPWLAYSFGFGKADDPELFGLLVLYTQITMPYLLFMSLTAMFSGILNARDKFAAAAAAPIFLNIVLVAILWFSQGESQTETALRLSIGVALSGILQVALVYWSCRRMGVKLRFPRPRWTPGVKRLVMLGVPGVLSAGAIQINIVVSSAIASIQPGAVSWLYYADRLYQLPLGMVGIAMGVALLPALSKRLGADDAAGANQTMNRAFELSMLLTLPAAVALAVIPDFLIGALYQHGAFTETDARNTAIAVFIFALGLPAFVLVKVFQPGFYARENTKTPMIYAVIAMVANVVIGAGLFFGGMDFVGLAIGTLASGWINTLLLLQRLVRDGLYAPDRRLFARLPRILIAAGLMGAALWFGGRALSPWLNQSIALDILLAVGLSAAGGIVYLVTALAVRATRTADLKGVFVRR